MKFKKVKAVFFGDQVPGDEVDPLRWQEGSPVGREQLPYPGVHKLFQRVLSFILAEHIETGVKLSRCLVSPYHHWHRFYKELPLGEDTSLQHPVLHQQWLAQQTELPVGQAGLHLPSILPFPESQERDF